MDKALFISHVWIVRVFLLFLIVKFVYMLVGDKDKFTSFRDKTKMVDMILGTLVLITGLTMAFRLPGGPQPYTWVKLGAVIASIPIGIVGFRKRSAVIAALSVVLIAGAMGLAYAKPAFLTKSAPPMPEVTTNGETGKTGEDKSKEAPNKEMAEMIAAGHQLYYQKTCNTCHGDDGKMGYMGAKPLNETALNDKEMAQIIVNGKTPMPANKDLTDKQIKQLIAYVRSLKE